MIIKNKVKNFKLYVIFWCISITLLAIWYWNTKVYRANFPASSLENLESFWKEREQIKLTFNVYDEFELEDYSKSNYEIKYKGKIKNADNLKSLEPKELLSLLGLRENKSNQLQFDLVLLNDNSSQSPLIYLYNDLSLKYHTTIFALFNKSLFKRENLIEDISSTFSNYLLGDLTINNKNPPIAVDYSSKYQITFTLMFGYPPSQFDYSLPNEIAHYLDETLHLYRDVFSPLIQFNVSTQVQHYAPLTFTPHLLNDSYVIDSNQLPQFINSAEWDLVSTVETSPDLNFLIYIPDPKFQPLRVLDNSRNSLKSNSFIIPKWGGVTIINNPKSPSLKQVKKAIKVHEYHLHQLLDIQPLLTNTLKNRYTIKKINSKTFGYIQWLQFSINLAKNLNNQSLKTLNSLKALIPTIPDMPVNDNIIALIEQSMYHIRESTFNLQSKKIIKSLYNAQKGFEFAENAFFHGEMVSQLYFPIDHSYALFLPLLLPLFIPLIMAILKGIKGYIKEKKVTTEKKTN